MGRDIKFRKWDRKNKHMGKPYTFGEDRWYKGCKDDIYMEYTGLNDVNSKEIYEGDIVKAPLDDLSEKGEIKFINGCWYIGQFLLGGFNYVELEVIGNIYEKRSGVND